MRRKKQFSSNLEKKIRDLQSQVQVDQNELQKAMLEYLKLNIELYQQTLYRLMLENPEKALPIWTKLISDNTPKTRVQDISITEEIPTVNIIIPPDDTE